MPELYKVVHNMTYLGQLCQNRYWYLTTGVDGTAESLAQLWADNFAPAVAGVQMNTVQHNSLTVEEVANGTDSHTVLFDSLTGNRSGQGLPPHDAYGLTFPVQTGATRSGAKRIVGISETDTNDGTVDGIWKSILDGLAQVLASYLFDALAEYLPVIVRDLGTSWGLNGIVDGNFLRVTTQNSRKPYKGGGGTVQLGKGTSSTSPVSAYTSLPSGVLATMSGEPRNSTTFPIVGWPVGIFKPTASPFTPI